MQPKSFALKCRILRAAGWLSVREADQLVPVLVPVLDRLVAGGRA
jgi:hypothetical protein